MSETRNNASETRGRPFPKGNSGRPKGARNKATLASEALLDGEAGALIRKAVDMALAADAIKAMAAIMTAVASGDLTPAEANELAKLIDTFTRAIEARELDERLKRLEATTK